MLLSRGKNVIEPMNKDLTFPTDVHEFKDGNGASCTGNHRRLNWIKY